MQYGQKLLLKGTVNIKGDFGKNDRWINGCEWVDQSKNAPQPPGVQEPCVA